MLHSLAALDCGVGACLRSLREQSAVTLKDAAVSVDASTATIRRWEAGEVIPKRPALRTLLDLYGVSAARSAVVEEVALTSRQARLPAVRSGCERGETVLACLEAQADAVYDYQSFLLPALVRTTAYMRAIYTGRGAPEPVEQALALHERRIGAAASGRCSLSIVVEESVLRRPIGATDVMRQQLDHLLEVANRSWAIVQVVPADAALLAGEAFTLVRLQDERGIVHCETAHGFRLLDDAHVATYTQAFARLQAGAQSPEASVALIASAHAACGE
ncbi:helix-turn-helix transcriptional regulator [Nonomuraea sp. NPDC026600]|uniref:helix-turn-helix domain-containing protein n=1 Tax=Nonomuraea sp. NPDC026600 TaxID=3155363 RepID=UPI0033C85537